MKLSLKHQGRLFIIGELLVVVGLLTYMNIYGQSNDAGDILITVMFLVLHSIGVMLLLPTAVILCSLFKRKIFFFVPFLLMIPLAIQFGIETDYKMFTMNLSDGTWSIYYDIVICSSLTGLPFYFLLHKEEMKDIILEE